MDKKRLSKNFKGKLYFYFKCDNNVEIFEIKPKSSDIEEYKKSEISSIPYNERVYVSYYYNNQSPIILPDEKWSWFSNEPNGEKFKRFIPQNNADDVLEKYFQSVKPTKGKTYCLIESSYAEKIINMEKQTLKRNI